MKILWVNVNFLHPTTKGGQIRTLGMLRELRRDHEIHYVAYLDPAHPEAVAQSQEYCQFAYPVHFQIPPHRSVAFARQVLGGLVSETPLAVSRFASPALQQQIELLEQQHDFDVLVCDFIMPAPNIPSLKNWTLFQHNVEAVLWERRFEHARNPLARWFYGQQARRMRDYERRICQEAGAVIAVSEVDAATMQQRYDLASVAAVPTGVDVSYFQPPVQPAAKADLMFLGSMDWAPNIDGVHWFVEEILPLVRQRRPQCSLAIVGRMPPPDIKALAAKDPLIEVTGTVPDVRPYLWGSKVSVVPLRIGGGTRLKIYESMAAHTAVVSTTVGAEGLEIHPPHDIRLADDPASFAAACVELLEQDATRAQLATAGATLVRDHCSWASVTARFASYLHRVPQAAAVRRSTA